MENKIPDFSRHSRTGTIVSTVGLFIILLSVIFFIYLDKEKDTRITYTKAMAIALQDSLKIVKKEIKGNIIECIAKQTQQSMTWKQPQYKFMFTVNDTVLVNKLDKVEYFFNHSSFDPNRFRRSQDASTNFRAYYLGWGCLNVVRVYLHYKNTSNVDTIYFRMCDKTKFEIRKL